MDEQRKQREHVVSSHVQVGKDRQSVELGQNIIHHGISLLLYLH